MRRTNCGRAPGELAMGGAAVQTARTSAFDTVPPGRPRLKVSGRLGPAGFFTRAAERGRLAAIMGPRIGW